jgi:hypothetical protein
MLGALGKGEEPGMAHTPSVQLIANPGDEKLPDAGVPQIRPGRQWPEKADVSPARREIRPYKLAVVIFRSVRSSVLRPEPSIEIVEVAPELLRVRCAEKSPKATPDDALRIDRLRSAPE